MGWLTNAGNQKNQTNSLVRARKHTESPRGQCDSDEILVRWLISDQVE